MIEPRLDAYAQDWQDTHTEVCKATSVRGEQSDEALDLRMRCLGQRRAALRATVDVLADTDASATVVDNAIELVAGLPTLTRCDDLPWLERHDALVPPPEDPDVAAAVQAQRAHLAQLEVMHRAGRYAEALDAIEPVLEQAKVLGYPPLRAEALSMRGALREGTGQYAEAEQDLRQAHALAVGHHHDPVALDTAQGLTAVVGLRLARHAEGQQWGEMVALPLAQRSGEPAQEARTLYNLGTVLTRQGELDNARIHLQRALAIWEQAVGPDHPDVADSLNSLSVVFHAQGELDNARVHLQRALVIKREVLGPDHPDVATILNNLGIVFNLQKDLDNARVHYEQALAKREQALGPDHPDVAGTLNNLGNLFFDRGELDEARVHLQRSLAIKRKALGPDHPSVANSLSNLGNVFLGQGDLDEARSHHQQAVTLMEKSLGPDHPHVAIGLNNLGGVSAAQGEYADARHYHQRALKIQNKALGPDHPDVASSLVGLATVAQQTGDPASARAHAERAVSIRKAVAVAPTLLAEARFVLARALWSERHERARAHALAGQARDAYAEHGPGKEDDLAEVEAWLATHRVQ